MIKCTIEWYSLCLKLDGYSLNIIISEIYKVILYKSYCLCSLFLDLTFFFFENEKVSCDYN